MSEDDLGSRAAVLLQGLLKLANDTSEQSLPFQVDSCCRTPPLIRLCIRQGERQVADIAFLGIPHFQCTTLTGLIQSTDCRHIVAAPLLSDSADDDEISHHILQHIIVPLIRPRRLPHSILSQRLLACPFCKTN